MRAYQKDERDDPGPVEQRDVSHGPPPHDEQEDEDARRRGGSRHGEGSQTDDTGDEEQSRRLAGRPRSQGGEEEQGEGDSAQGHRLTSRRTVPDEPAVLGVVRGRERTLDRNVRHRTGSIPVHR